jgi:hypothetical protein
MQNTIKTKKNLEKKIYEIIQDRYEEFKDGTDTLTRKDWEDYLDSLGIEHFHCDGAEGIIECLVEMVNEAKDTVVCADPWMNDEINYGDGDGLLAIPTQLAEKILVLRFIP